MHAELRINRGDKGQHLGGVKSEVEAVVGW